MWDCFYVGLSYVGVVGVYRTRGAERIRMVIELRVYRRPFLVTLALVGKRDPS